MAPVIVIMQPYIGQMNSVGKRFIKRLIVDDITTIQVASYKGGNTGGNEGGSKVKPLGTSNNEHDWTPGKLNMLNLLN